MGGAVALLIHKSDPDFWHGAVLVAPMCKVGVVLHFSCYRCLTIQLFRVYQITSGSCNVS